jgi:gluconate 2-dehydrogenase gamma chain
MDLTRRDWVLATACWTELLQAQSPKFAWFDAASAAEIEAIAAQIIPDDETAGAKGAGVIWFIDSALAGFDEDKRGLYKRGLAETQTKRAEMFPGSSSIASLTADRQIALLKAIEMTEFFQQVRAHSVLGFFAHPVHGGSHDIAGWKLMGMDHSMGYQPPFGYYDAEAGKQ